jgi:hypothetical protein
MTKSAARLIAISLTICSCAPQAPLVTSIDTLCVSTSRYHTTAEQKAAFAADEGTWGTLVRWLAGFNKVRDGQCLEPGKGN